MPSFYHLLERAQQVGQLSQSDWEKIYSSAIEGNVQEIRDMNSLFTLVSLVIAGEVAVEGVTQTEVIRRLSVLA
ncbi:hypothetical protein [Desulfuromonas sp. AOP6]|uniref:hypothetical protein n=1 Tax=Desulfuromonas sp. AOP6 TaxID=1566351 RepID=UPI00128524FC|nr:hypothetical protein [Desulfuromonas sp. AOP6]BCA79712.1 hypothetical protein AOP6_1499 [Desulfuromonas sp. AOP6]